MRQNFLLIQNTQRSCVTAVSLPLSLVHDGTPHYPSLLAQSPGNPLHGATIGKFHRGLMAQFQQQLLTLWMEPSHWDWAPPGIF